MKNNNDITLIIIDNFNKLNKFSSVFKTFIAEIKKIKDFRIKYILNNSKSALDYQDNFTRNLFSCKNINYATETIVNTNFKNQYLFEKFALLIFLYSNENFNIVKNIQKIITLITNETNNNLLLIQIVYEEFLKKKTCLSENQIREVIEKYLYDLFQKKFIGKISESSASKIKELKDASYDVYIKIGFANNNKPYTLSDSELRELSNQIDFRFFKIIGVLNEDKRKEIRYVHPYIHQLLLLNDNPKLLGLNAFYFWDQYMNNLLDRESKGRHLEQVFGHVLSLPKKLAKLNNKSISIHKYNDIKIIGDLVNYQYSIPSDPFEILNKTCENRIFESLTLSDNIKKFINSCDYLVTNDDYYINFLQKLDMDVYYIDGALLSYTKPKKVNSIGVKNIYLFQATIGDKSPMDMFKTLKEIIRECSIFDQEGINLGLHFSYYFILPNVQEKINAHFKVIQEFIDGIVQYNQIYKNIPFFFSNIGVVAVSQDDSKEVFNFDIVTYDFKNIMNSETSYIEFMNADSISFYNKDLN